jgi:hypothetical protein
MFFLVVMPLMIFAQDEKPIDFGSASSILTWLAPIITLGATLASTWLIKKISPIINGATTLIIVPLVSTAISYLGTLVSDEANFFTMFFGGIGSVFLNQFYRQLTKK